jgi:hypothetical protein
MTDLQCICQMLGMVLEEFVTTNILYFYMKRTCLFYATCNAFIYEDLIMHIRFTLHGLCDSIHGEMLPSLLYL